MHLSPQGLNDLYVVYNLLKVDKFFQIIFNKLVSILINIIKWVKSYFLTIPWQPNPFILQSNVLNSYKLKHDTHSNIIFHLFTAYSHQLNLYHKDTLSNSQSTRSPYFNSLCKESNSQF